jgi:WD40 repeat protein
VFAIGAMLWELCSLQKTPPNESGQRRRLLRKAGIDQDLVAIVDKALDADPRRRYRDAGELAADLKAFKSGARITARSYSVVGALAHWTRRHRAAALAALAFALLLVGSIAALGVLYQASERNADTARQNAEIARRSAETARERLVHSYEEQGRHALLDGKSMEALVYLGQAYNSGDASPAVRFMLARAMQPRLSERARLTSKSRMWSAMFSRDGSRIVTTDDRGGQVWDAVTHRLLFTLPHENIVRHALFSPDEKYVITGGLDGFVKIWDAETGVLVHALGGHNDTGKTSMYGEVAVSPDGKVVGGIDSRLGRAHVWDVVTGGLLATFSSARGEDATLAFSHDARWLAISADEQVLVIDTRTWTVKTTLPMPKVRRVRFASAGARLVTGASRGDVSIWEVPSGKRLQHLRDLGDAINDVLFSPDGALVAAASGDGSVAIWKAEKTIQLQSRVKGCIGFVEVIEFSKDSRFLMSGCTGGEIDIFDVATGLPMATLEGATQAIMDVRFDADARHVIGASLDGAARIWDNVPGYRRWASQRIGRECGTDVTLEGDHRIIAVSCGEHGTRVWDTAQDRLIAELPGTTIAGDRLNWAFPALSAADGLSGIARDRVVEIYRLPGGELLRTVQHSAPITTVRFSTNGHDLVTGSSDGEILITREGVESSSLPARPAAVDSAAFLPDGRVVVVDAAQRLTLLDPAHSAEVVSFVLPHRARTLRISPDGRRLIVIAMTGGPVPPVLCDLEQGRVVSALEGHGNVVYSAQFVNDGREILTAGTDGTARLWDGPNAPTWVPKAICSMRRCRPMVQWWLRQPAAAIWSSGTRPRVPCCGRFVRISRSSARCTTRAVTSSRVGSRGRSLAGRSRSRRCPRSSVGAWSACCAVSRNGSTKRPVGSWRNGRCAMTLEGLRRSWRVDPQDRGARGRRIGRARPRRRSFESARSTRAWQVIDVHGCVSATRRGEAGCRRRGDPAASFEYPARPMELPRKPLPGVVPAGAAPRASR